jgi:hypothetical protein
VTQDGITTAVLAALVTESKAARNARELQEDRETSVFPFASFVMTLATTP